MPSKITSALVVLLLVTIGIVLYLGLLYGATAPASNFTTVTNTVTILRTVTVTNESGVHRVVVAEIIIVQSYEAIPQPVCYTYYPTITNRTLVVYNETAVSRSGIVTFIYTNTSISTTIIHLSIQANQSCV